MKVATTIVLTFAASDDAGALDLVRAAVAALVANLARNDCREIKPDIVAVAANGRSVPLAQRARAR